MTKEQIIELALEALERSVATCFDQYAHQQVMSQPDHFMNQAITAIKEALAQPEQEPVAWEQFYPDIGKPQIAFNSEVIGYVAPQRTWVGLTNEEIDKTLRVYEQDYGWISFAKAIEAKLKEKNT
jgi:hypothetical protein